VKIGIVACKPREERAMELAQTIEADHISIDDDKLGCRENHRQVWKHLAEHADPDDWLIIMEDDIIPIPNFREQATQALKAAPADVVSFYFGKLAPKPWQETKAIPGAARAQREDPHWLISDRLHSNQCCAIRGTFLVEKMLAITACFNRPMDEAITIWCRKYGHDIAYTWPSLVDHDDQIPSRAVHPDGIVRVPGRVAWKTGSRNGWTGKSIKL
jgi:hypothetical protein